MGKPLVFIGVVVHVPCSHNVGHITILSIHSKMQWCMHIFYYLGSALISLLARRNKRKQKLGSSRWRGGSAAQATVPCSCFLTINCIENIPLGFWSGSYVRYRKCCSDENIEATVLWRYYSNGVAMKIAIHLRATGDVAMKGGHAREAQALGKRKLVTNKALKLVWVVVATVTARFSWLQH